MWAQPVKLDEEVGCFSTTPKGIAITLVNLCQFIKGPSVIILDFRFHVFPKKQELAHSLVEIVGVTVQSKWRAVGLRLGLDEPQLDTIQQTHQGSVNSVQDCMTDVFAKWYEGNTSEYSWRNLAEVLCSQMVNMPQILGDIHAKLISKYNYM